MTDEPESRIAHDIGEWMEEGGRPLERSADFSFAKDQIAVRGHSRVDADLTDATAISVLHQAVT